MTIARNAYVDERVFQEEIQHLFSRRFFVATAVEMAQKDAYLSFQLGRHALTLRNSPHGPRLFSNVCLHRNALIDPAGSGQRPFHCRYHGWGYGTDGELVKAPFSDPACISNRQLQEHQTATAGGLVFASLEADAMEVGEIPALLLKTGLGVEQAFYHAELAHECNWKLLVENVLEGYHLNFVHDKTFLPTGMNSLTPGEWGGDAYTSWSRAIPDPSDRLSALKHFSGAAHQYLHGYVFPNLFLANTNNLVGFTSSLMPISTSRTLLRWQLFELPALKSLPNNVREQIRTDAIEFSHRVLAEDKIVTESCQVGMACIGPDPQLQPAEARLRHFQEMYRKAMSTWTA